MFSIKRALGLFALTSAVALVMSGIALADIVHNDVVANGNDTITAPATTTTVNYRIGATSNDPDGCNVEDSTPATLTINVPPNVSRSPASLTFDECDDPKPVVFTSSTIGQYNITVSVNDADGSDDYNVQPAKFTLYVRAASGGGTGGGTNQTPQVSVTGVVHGQEYDKGSVPVAACNVIDDQPVVTMPAATLSPISGPYAADGIGSQTASCTYTDAGGATGTATATYSITDPSGPSISYVVNPAAPDGANDWYRSNVTLTWTVTDPDSPTSLQKTGCVDQDIQSNQAATTYTCSATSAGGSAGPVSVSIKRDANGPSIVDLGPTPAAPNGNNGWYTSNVTNNWTASDTPAGLADEANASITRSTTADGAYQTLSTGSIADEAGNTNSDDSVAFNVDTHAPTITDNGPTPASPNGSNGWYTTAVSNNWTAGDATSGLADAAQSSITASTTTEGSALTLSSGAVSDLAGNIATADDAGPFMVDTTGPTQVSFTGGPADGGVYYFGSVPAGPSGCTASESVSSPASCDVSGYSDAVGSHTITAHAVNQAGLVTDVTRTYSVLAWTLKGFYQPVDMNGVINTVKNGSTVPLKFEIFAGPNELTSVAAVQGFTVVQTSCSTAGVTDDIELTTTGSTVLRYDTSGGQFIQNWQTPKKPGFCYRVTMTAMDGSTLTALFKLK